MITIIEEQICGGCEHHVYHFSTISQDYKITSTILADCVKAQASAIKVLTIKQKRQWQRRTNIAMVGLYGLTGAADGRKNVCTIRGNIILPSEERCG